MKWILLFLVAITFNSFAALTGKVVSIFWHVDAVSCGRPFHSLVKCKITIE